MKKDDVKMVKVKALAATRWDKEPVAKGATLEVPESTLELNPKLFEAVTEEEKEEAKPKK